MPQVDRFVSGRGYGQVDDYTREIDSLDPQSVFPLLDLRSRSASLVLGEPGVGKSTALRWMHRSLSASGVEVRLVDLRDCISDSGLERGFDEVADSLPGSAAARVLLVDSVDEAPGLIRNYVRFLTNRLTTLVEEGWSVIAACRTAESVQALDELFDGLQPGAVHVLLPLRRSDVLDIAESRGIPALEFLDQIARKRLESLAAIPFTLNLLCRIYEADSKFPDSRVEIFERAVALILAEDAIDGYTPAPAREVEPLRQRVTAERLAGFSAFAELSDFGLFRVGEALAGVQTETLVGTEAAQGVDFKLENADFQGVLHTALFANSGPNQRVFAHRRLRDFLAAKYLLRQSLDLSQQQSILTVSEGDISVPPQMIDIVTWLVTIDPAAFGWVVEADPLSLTRNRLADDVPQLAPRLVELLVDRAYAVDRLLSWRDELTGREHAGLARQVLAALEGDESQQVVALRVLKSSYVPGVEDALLRLVKDQGRSTRVRKLALELMDERDLGSQLSRVSPLADEFFSSDGDAELRGAVLDALWPDHLDVDGLVSLLIPPPERLFGAYFSALRRLERNLTPELARSLLVASANGDNAENRPRLRGRGLRDLVDRALQLVVEAPDLDSGGER